VEVSQQVVNDREDGGVLKHFAHHSSPFVLESHEHGCDVFFSVEMSFWAYLHPFKKNFILTLKKRQAIIIPQRSVEVKFSFFP